MSIEGNPFPRTDVNSLSCDAKSVMARLHVVAPTRPRASDFAARTYGGIEKKRAIQALSELHAVGFAKKDFLGRWSRTDKARRALACFPWLRQVSDLNPAPATWGYTVENRPGPRAQ